MDFFDAKGILEALLSRVRLQCSFEPDEDSIFLPGRCAAIVAGDSTLGVVGEVHTQILERFEIDATPVALFELDLTALLRALSLETSQYRSIPRYPAPIATWPSFWTVM